MPPLDPSVLTDPAHGQQNLEWGLRYEAARAKAAGLDPSSPAGQSQLLGLYNGGGDPNYVQHVQARMNGQAPAPMTSTSQMAYDSAPAAPQTDPSAASGITYTPPLLPDALQARLNDNSGLFKSARSRQLLAMAQGFLSGSGAGAGNFGAGLSRAAGNVLQEQDQDNGLALDVYKTQMQQAQAALSAQRYGSQLMLGGQRVAVQQDAQAEKARHDGATENQGAQGLDIKQQGVDARQQQVDQQGAIGSANAATNRYRAQTQAANVGAPLPPALPGIGASGLGMMAPVPQQTPSGPATGPSTPPPQSPTWQPPQPPQGASTASPGAPPSAPAPIPGMGASGLSSSPSMFPMAGSNYDNLQGGLQARRQTQALNQKTIQKGTDADTGLLEGYNQADTVAKDQQALLTRFQQEHPDLTTGTGWWGNFSKWLTTQTNDPTAQELDKNAAAITQTNYPHGVGQLRVAELKTAATLAPGMGQSFDAANHLIDQGLLQRAQMRQILQGRQQWVNQHPNESPDIGYDPIANDWQSRNPAYVEGPDGKVQSGVQQPLLGFARAHVDPQTGRYVPPNDPVAVAAGAKAFPSGGSQPADPVAAAAGQRAFSPVPASSPQSAPAQTASNPFAAQIRTRLQDPAFRQRALQARGQAWVDHYSQ